MKPGWESNDVRQLFEGEELGVPVPVWSGYSPGLQNSCHTALSSPHTPG